MVLRRVVLPAPKNPVSTVTGMRLSALRFVPVVVSSAAAMVRCGDYLVAVITNEALATFAMLFRFYSEASRSSESDGTRMFLGSRNEKEPVYFNPIRHSA